MNNSNDPHILCVGFDGCLCENAFPDIGEPNMQVITDLKVRVDHGWTVILHTSRQGVLLAEAVGWCKAHGIRFAAIKCKPYADEYWGEREVAVGQRRYSR